MSGRVVRVLLALALTLGPPPRPTFPERAPPPVREARLGVTGAGETVPAETVPAWHAAPRS